MPFVSGAVIVGKNKSTIIFDRNGLEGGFSSQFPEQLMGRHAWLLGVLGTTWAENPKQMDWIEASTIGFKLACKLHVLGYELVEKDNCNYLHFPTKALADYYRELRTSSKEKEADNLLEDIIDNLRCFSLERDALRNKADGDNWTILENNMLHS
jgi:hypothetical protein